jgi:putative regulator of septum formation/uncharacterized protein DUF4190
VTESRPPEPASTRPHVTPPPYDGGPAYGTPPPSPPYPGQPRGTDGMAIAALVLAIIPGTALIGFILGLVALSRIRRSARGGRGLAIAAIVISVVWALVLAGLIALGVALTPSRDTTGDVTKPGSVGAAELKAGDCVTTVPTDLGAVRSLDVTPCTKPHRAEVYAVFDLPKGDYPGEQAVTKRAEDGCGTRLPTIDESKQRGLGVDYIYPKRVNWQLGDRSVTCLVESSTPVTTRIVPKR